jgi:hypothetical protein
MLQFSNIENEQQLEMDDLNTNVELLEKILT